MALLTASFPHELITHSGRCIFCLHEMHCWHKHFFFFRRSGRRSTVRYLNLKWPWVLCNVYIISMLTLCSTHPPPSISSSNPCRPPASEQLFQKSFFHLHHLQEAHRAQNNTNSPLGFSLSPHFSCAVFPWVVFAITMFILLRAFAHIHPSCIYFKNNFPIFPSSKSDLRANGAKEEQLSVQQIAEKNIWILEKCISGKWCLRF